MIHVAPGTDPVAWAMDHRDDVMTAVRRDGRLVINGLGLLDGASVAAVRQALALAPADCPDRFADRSELADRVYSAPQWAADREQCLHHEQGYGASFPSVLLIACLTPADTGGALLLGDTRTVMDHLPADLLGRFGTEGWLLERHFRPYFGPSWTTALGVSDPADLERRCAEMDIDVDWLADGTLRLRQHRSAILAHPITRESCWFNDIAFFSQFSVDSEERSVLLGAFGPDGLPFNTRFGGGDEFGSSDWQAMIDAYDAVLCRVDLSAGDLVIIDNVLTAHGREPYTGPWELAIAPAEPAIRAHDPRHDPRNL